LDQELPTNWFHQTWCNGRGIYHLQPALEPGTQDLTKSQLLSDVTTLPHPQDLPVVPPAAGATTACPRAAILVNDLITIVRARSAPAGHQHMLPYSWLTRHQVGCLFFATIPMLQRSSFPLCCEAALEWAAHQAAALKFICIYVHSCTPTAGRRRHGSAKQRPGQGAHTCSPYNLREQGLPSPGGCRS
jgi:hypothetical protein